MTTLAVNYNSPHYLAANDKELKEKYGQSANIIPEKNYEILENKPKILEKSPQKDTVEKGKSSKETVKHLFKGVPALIGAYLLDDSSLKIRRKSYRFFVDNMIYIPETNSWKLKDNGKHPFRRAAAYVDKKLVNGNSRISKLVRKLLSYKGFAIYERIPDLICRGARSGAIGLGVIGVYQLMKATISALCDK